MTEIPPNVLKVLDKFARLHAYNKWDDADHSIPAKKAKYYRELAILAFKAGQISERNNICNTLLRDFLVISPKDAITITDEDGIEWVYLKKKG